MAKMYVKFLVPLVILCGLGFGAMAVPNVPAPNAGELAELAVGYVKADKKPLAWQALEQALAMEPDNYRVNYVAGLLAFQDQQIAVAEKYLQKAHELSPKSTDTLITLGAVYHSRDELTKAKAYYAKAVELEPTNAKALYNLGMAAYDSRDALEAKKYLESYLKVSPKANDAKKVQRRIETINRWLEKQKGSKAS